MVRWLLGEVRRRVCRLLCTRDETRQPDAASARPPRHAASPSEPRWDHRGDAWRSDAELEAADRRPAAEPGPSEPRWSSAGDAWLGRDDDDK